MQKTLDQQIQSVQREIAMRQRLYPKWVEQKTMTLAQSAHEIQCMESVLRTLFEMRTQQEHAG